MFQKNKKKYFKILELISIIVISVYAIWSANDIISFKDLIAPIFDFIEIYTPSTTREQKLKLDGLENYIKIRNEINITAEENKNYKWYIIGTVTATSILVIGILYLNWLGLE